MVKQPHKTKSNQYSSIWVGIALAAVCFIAGIGTGAFLWRGEESAQHAALDGKQQTQLVSSGYEAAGFLLAAADNLAKERGLAYSALKSTGHIPSEVREKIEQVRDRANRDLNQALELIENQLAFDRNSRFMRRVAKNQETLKKMREEVDRSTSSEDAKANTERANEWFAQSSRLLTSSEQLLELVHSKIRSVGIDIDSAVALKLQRLAIIMVDFVGRERAVVSGAIAENKQLDESISGWILPAYRGRINGIWTSIKAMAASSTLSPEITSLIAKVERDYFDDLELLRERIQNASKIGESYPITADEWFAKASAVIDTIVNLGQEAGQLARAKSERVQKPV